MKYYVPLDKPDQAVELARDKTWEFWQDLVDSDYDPDGMTITTTIKEVNGRYVIEIKQRRKTRLFFIFLQTEFRLDFPSIHLPSATVG